MKNQFSIILFFIILLYHQNLCDRPEFYQRGEEYKDCIKLDAKSYVVAFYVMTNYDELSKKRAISHLYQLFQMMK